MGHRIERHGRPERIRIVGGVRLARPALIPLHDREVVFPWALERVRRWHRRRAGSTMEDEQDGIAAVSPANGNPLCRAINLERHQLLHAAIRTNLARVCDDARDLTPRHHCRYAARAARVAWRRSIRWTTTGQDAHQSRAQDRRLCRSSHLSHHVRKRPLRLLSRDRRTSRLYGPAPPEFRNRRSTHVTRVTSLGVAAIPGMDRSQDVGAAALTLFEISRSKRGLPLSDAKLGSIRIQSPVRRYGSLSSTSNWSSAFSGSPTSR